mgnify:CR=1 FL=1
MEGFVVKALRTNLGLNQGDFAREVGVSQQMISLIESDNLKIMRRFESE